MRHIKEVQITGGESNRDSGKIFIITEMSASQAERWANRAIIAIGNSGAKVDHTRGMGMNGVAILGLQALLGVSEGPALSLLDELMSCVTIKVEAMPGGRQLTEADIEEVMTRYYLKQEVFAVHTGFSWAELQSMLSSATKALASSNILGTSRARSASSSRRAKRPSTNSKRTSASKTSTT